ncbi:hypothetical protein [Comamonas sp.]|uniref:hypothetical protein n=1 Tax=Comamonas sp. TaxID=34028 RepID=UPI003D0AB6E7
MDDLSKEWRHLVRRHIELLRDYEDFLDRNPGHSHPPLFPVRYEPVVIERACPLERDPGGLMEMLVAPGNRQQGLRNIREETRDCRNLIILDPYIFSGPSARADDIAADLEEALFSRRKSIQSVHVVYSDKPGDRTGAVRKAVLSMFARHKTFVSEARSSALHDRVWIFDRTSALLVGTSLNGIGNRLAFILPLPHEDLLYLLSYLDDNGLSRHVAA